MGTVGGLEDEIVTGSFFF